MNDPVAVTVDGGVATLTLTRPERRNALSGAVSRAIVDALDGLEGGDARVLVVEGAGEAFCAGGDVDAMVERLAGDVPIEEAVRRMRQETSRAVQRLHDFYLPTVAKVDGVAFGAGANLAIATDVQLASEDAAFSFGFRSVGLAVDSGTSYLLPRVVGENVAKELVFTGETVEADRAAELGLVNHVYPAETFDERVAAFVEAVATGPTVALRQSKRLLDDGFETSLSQAMANEAAAQAAALATDDHREGAEAFVEKREPEFEGR